MADNIVFEPIDRSNWEEAITLSVAEGQRKFVPSVAESLAAAYVKPWDEALDPFLIRIDGTMVGCFYLSYTPESCDNYWIGGFLIDQRYQRRGYGKAALLRILEFIPTHHPACEVIKLTVEKDNAIAQRLYQSLGFADTGKVNKYDEIIYTMPAGG